MDKKIFLAKGAHVTPVRFLLGIRLAYGTMR